MFVLVFVAILGFATTALAGDFVCEKTSTPGKYTRYVASQPSLTPNPDETCTQVNKANAPSQQELNGVYTTTANTIPFKYRKVSGGLTVSMTQGEKDAVDAALAAAAAAREVFQTEVNTQDLCSSQLLSEIATKIDTYFDNSQATMTTAVNAITTATTAANMANIKNAAQAIAQEHAALRVPFKKVMNCIIAIKKGAR